MHTLHALYTAQHADLEQAKETQICPQMKRLLSLSILWLGIMYLTGGGEVHPGTGS